MRIDPLRIGRVPIQLASLLACLCLALSLIACEEDDPDDDARSAGSPTVVALDDAAAAGAEPSPSAPLIGSGDGYPAPSGASPDRPVATPELHDSVDDLPSDATLDPTSALACPRTNDAPPGRALALIPATTDDGADLIAVASDFERSVAGWRLSDHLPPGFAAADLTDLRQRNAWVIDADSGASPPALVVQATVEEQEILWVVECGYAPNADLTAEAAGPSTIAALVVEVSSPVAGNGRVELRLADWSGDGIQEVLAGDWKGRVLFADGGTGRWEAVMPLDGGSAVVDLDGDNQLEAVSLLPDGTWQLRAWDGAKVEETIAEDLAPAIAVADPEALPQMPSDLYLLGAIEADAGTWRWPATGGPIERVDDAGARGHGPWHSLNGRYRRDSARSLDGTIEVAHQLDDLATPLLLSTDPADLASGATRVGTILLIDPSGAVADRALVATYEREHEDYGLRSFLGLALSDDGERLAWSDGAGLWTSRLPDGQPELLTPWARPFTDDADVITGIHRPSGWSPDGRFLLVEIGYHEGGDYGMWDLGDGSFARIPDSFGYVDGWSDIAWLPSGRLLHARSGGDFGGNASLSLLDQSGLEDRTYLYQTWPRLHEMASATVLGFAERPNGSLIFGLRSNLPFDSASNGIFVLESDGNAPERIAGLPILPPNDDDPFTGGGFRCQLIFAPDAASFVCSGRAAGSRDQQTLVGRTDTGEVWDVTQVFGPDGVGPFDAVAFGAKETSN